MKLKPQSLSIDCHGGEFLYESKEEKNKMETRKFRELGRKYRQFNEIIIVRSEPIILKE